MIDRDRLNQLYIHERQEFNRMHPASKAAYANATNLFGRVPMTWMNKKASDFPIYLDRAEGNRIWDIDGIEYIDFSLGDTCAMAGHSAPEVVAAVEHRVKAKGGMATMLPTEDAEWVAANLTERFGMTKWSFSLTATDANRWAIRLARAIIGKPKILCNSYCYHGSVDEALVIAGRDGKVTGRPGSVGVPVDITLTTRVVEFNDIDGLEQQLKQGDVAAVLMEPALTNIGIVLPQPGYHEAVRALTRQYGALLIIDEAHTFSADYGGMTRRDRLEPDIFVIGKAIAGGIATGAYGLSEAVAEKALSRTNLDLVDMGGIGGTLAGNPLSVAAMRATLEKVLTEENFATMIRLGTYFTDGVNKLFERYQLPWSINQLGARAEYRFTKPYPVNGSDSAKATDANLANFFHLYLANRGVILTPFHNMALMCPVTTEADIDRHHAIFEEAIQALLD